MPERLRRSGTIRPLALRLGLIPPRTMHTPAEADLLRQLAGGRRRAVEIGVYEGSSALALVEALPPDAELHLVEPFGVGMEWWEPADEKAVRAVVGWAARRRGGPRITWHVALSSAVADGWSGPTDLVFVDGDHSEEGCRSDWELWSPHVPAGGTMAFHDARLGRPAGWGERGPTTVVDSLFRGEEAVPGWRLSAERDTVVVVERLPSGNRSAPPP